MFDRIGFRVRYIRRGKAFHAAAQAPPGLRARCHSCYRPHNHGVFVIDPDGDKVEAVCPAPT
ncbi:MAG: hypothetical protein ACRC2B_20505 [Rubrivivax sp.]